MLLRALNWTVDWPRCEKVITSKGFSNHNNPSAQCDLTYSWINSIVLLVLLLLQLIFRARMKWKISVKLLLSPSILMKKFTPKGVSNAVLICKNGMKVPSIFIPLYASINCSLRLRRKFFSLAVDAIFAVLRSANRKSWKLSPVVNMVENQRIHSYSLIFTFLLYSTDTC